MKKLSMLKDSKWLVAVFFFTISVLQIKPCQAQKAPPLSCASTTKYQKEHLSALDKKIFDDNEKRLKAYIASSAAARRADASTDPIYTIPVVVHVIEPYEQTLLTDQQIIDGIAKLSDAFRNRLPDSDGADIQIRFQLASNAPDCSPSTGIIRIDQRNNDMYRNHGVGESGDLGISATDIYGMSYWNNLDYYNIWVVNYIGFTAAMVGFPTGGYSPYDGCMIRADYFNGKTLAHELGHALNLWHPFARGIGEGDLDLNECPLNENCAEQGDCICDTEPANQTIAWACPGTLEYGNACNSGAPFGNVIKNLMNWGNECLTQFTNDQRTRMRAALELLRPGLINSNKLDPYVEEQIIQKGTAATLTATTCKGVVLWYEAFSGGNFIGPGKTFTTPLLTESRTYYAACLRVDCGSSNRVPAVVTVAGSLPVQIISFEAKVLERNLVTLKWATSFEQSHDHFDVESAGDAKSFRKAGQVFAPFLTASGKSEYQFTDRPALDAEQIYYRLKQVDNDGSYAYSKIVSVRIPRVNQITIGPNPAENLITIHGVVDNWEVEVISATGVMVQRVKNKIHIDSRQLPAGLYLVRVISENGNIVTRKMVKN
ncbi:Ig-like domain-containing protein [Dyadobacter arcticus]|uniref:T9SS type A sorting domain-containing protein n=1 Tax=Dyadobacter arcticus TaxID=1078754 RepID=A0ABX0UR41_9BACT|nr:T9SS type A sorting domain-containing protein [Dyadobacter arcticus]NIJ55463.1 hypothetical protein [Dyadobacter arcticus]